MKPNQKSITRTVVSGKDQRVQAYATAGKSGFAFIVVHQELIDGVNRKGAAVKVWRTLPDGAGARAVFATAVEAEKAVNAAADALLKRGWSQPEGPRGFAAKPDAFSIKTLPAPRKSK